MSVPRLSATALLIWAFMPLFTITGAPIAKASQVTLTGENGPASAILTINQDHRGNLYPHLIVSYTGYLYHCTSWNYGRSGETVQSVLIVPISNGKNLIRRQLMQPECYYHGLGEDRALMVVTSSDHQVWEAVGLPLHGQIPDEIEFELAFEKRGQWDSRHGQNYRIRLNLAQTVQSSEF